MKPGGFAAHRSGVSTTLLPSRDSFAEVTDDQAVDEVVRGNREMFEVLVRRHNPRLYRVGISYLREPMLVEDAMQNAYLKAYLHLAQFNRAAAFSTWLTRILINECLLLLRRRRAKGEAPLDAEAHAQLEETAPVSAVGEDGKRRLSLNEMKTLLEQAVQSLPRTYRTVYVLREVQQLSTAETAACLGIPANSVKVRLHRARELLRQRLLQTAAGVELFAFTALRCDPLTSWVMQCVLRVGRN